MPIDSSIVGLSAEPVFHDIDARWMMAYAAALGDTLPCYFDTARPDGIVSHPLFPSCFEWPAFLAMRARLSESGLKDAEMLRGVHATDDTILHSPIRVGARLITHASIGAVRRIKAGAYVVTKMETRDVNDTRVCTTHYGSIFRGVEVTGPDRTVESIAANAADLPLESAPLGSTPIIVSPGLAHVYTECARIWNPIHTDAAVAVAAGLPAIILHGTATLALAVSKIVETEAGARPDRVIRVAGRFAAMVLLPSKLTLRILARQEAQAGETIRFDLRSENDAPAIRNGLVTLSQDTGDQKANRSRFGNIINRFPN
jgi:acyl dehydratase